MYIFKKKKKNNNDKVSDACLWCNVMMCGTQSKKKKLSSVVVVFVRSSPMPHFYFPNDVIGF